MDIRFLLDTSVASYAINKKNVNVDLHIARHAMAELAISAVTEGELRYGATLKGSAPLLATLERFFLSVVVQPWDSQAAKAYSELRTNLHRQGHPLGSIDMLIGAHALSVGATLISSDSAFKRIQGLKVEDWTKPLN